MAPTARRDGTPDNRSSRGPRNNQKFDRQDRSGRQDRPQSFRPQRGDKPASQDTQSEARQIEFASRAKPARHQHVDPSEKRTRPVHTDDGVRLQKVLASAGVASRRMSEQLIEAGRVEVNGKVVTTQGLRVDPNKDVIRVDGSRIVVDESMVYFALNKPRGLQSTMHDDMGRPCVGDIVGERVDAGQRLFHVGRLDADTEGLLLLTNDGELANRLMHPRYEVQKTYLATVLGEVNRGTMRTLRDGIELDDGVAKADEADIIDVWQGRSLVKIVLHEGRKHIVRRMLKEAGFPVQSLVRTRIHTVNLGEQKPGTLRALNRAEMASLFKVVDM